MKLSLWILALFFTLTTGYTQPTKAYLMGKFNPEQHRSFTTIAPKYWTGGPGLFYLRKECYRAFIKMAKSAQKDGVKLTLVSATRNFDAQKRIWEKKWRRLEKNTETGQVNDGFKNAKTILLYSSMPGTSRHHWGTDIDIVSVEPEFFETEAGIKIYDWLTRHAWKFGFCQPYSSKTMGRTGYEEEKWHWSYFPLSKVFLERYNTLIKTDDLTDFMGSKYGDSLDIIRQYVNGVECSTQAIRKD